MSADLRKWTAKAFVSFLMAALAGITQGAQPSGQDNKLKLESSSGITAEVEKTITGELKKEDQQQASLLAAHLLQDIREAQLAIDDDNLDAAATRLKKASDLAAIIQKLLPVTKVSVIVKDKEGKVLYEDSHLLQPHSIPISQSLVVVDLLRPFVAEKKAAKKEPRGEVGGVQLKDSEIVATQVSVDVSFVARRIHDAERLLKSDHDKASDTLLAAIEGGVTTVSAEIADPLVQVRDALWYANRAVASRNYAEARANLGAAREQLMVFNDLLTPAEQKESAALTNEIQQIENELKNPNPTPERHSKTLAGLEQAANRVMRWFGAKGNTAPTAPQTVPTTAEPPRKK
jgi:hypothetical protein